MIVEIGTFEYEYEVTTWARVLDVADENPASVDARRSIVTTYAADRIKSETLN